MTTIQKGELKVTQIGSRIKCIQMKNDPRPIESGTEGTVYHIGGGIVNVKWDNGRNLGLVLGEDEFEFSHSTGPEFHPDTKWIYKNEDLTLEICNDAKITQTRATNYLNAKMRN